MLRYVVGWVGWVFVGLVVIFLFLDWLIGVVLECLLMLTVLYEEVLEVGRLKVKIMQRLMKQIVISLCGCW